MNTKANESIQTMVTSTRRRHRLLTISLAAIACLNAAAAEDIHPHDQDREGAHYRQIGLVSDLPGIAQLQDPSVVNAWGIAHGPATFFWLSDNATGVSTLYALTNDVLTRNEHLVELYDGGNVSVVDHIGLQSFGMGKKCPQEILGRKKAEMSHRNKCGGSAGCRATQSSLD